jgi:hypothetical protein
VSVSIPSDFSVGNIVKSQKVRDALYAAGGLISIAIVAVNAAVAYLIAQDVVTFPLWLGVTNVVFPVVAAPIFGLAKANPSDKAAARASGGAS